MLGIKNVKIWKNALQHKLRDNDRLCKLIRV